MVISHNNHPDNEGVIDQFTNEVYSNEWFNTKSHEYAMEVVHYYTNPFFADEWFTEWILTEEFRGGRYPDGNQIPPEGMLRYERMHTLYWAAYSEFGYKLFANVHIKNLQESVRSNYLHTLTTNQTWEEFSKAVAVLNQNHDGVVTHNREG